VPSEFDEWKSAFARARTIKGDTRMTGLYIAARILTGHYDLSYTALATATGQSRANAIRMVKILIRRGWLRNIEASSKTNRAANKYELAMAAPASSITPTIEA
jgi:hypothetical protein